ncbi:hypothetical protein [Streptomyces sp. NBC_00878]|uniref:hypothetical protein n=1 Tax=Streptomyces sp. NBC_00878 TaxID=2975854 RepID=UPI002258A1F8|nr:hypothetical protein [Streptomyces sp. NBC_00878]MCX4911745.1 hypothetical protein [Streptomyces sp. NBC_00878]
MRRFTSPEFGSASAPTEFDLPEFPATREKAEYFGRRVPPLVREPEAQLPHTEPESAPVHA